VRALKGVMGCRRSVSSGTKKFVSIQLFRRERKHRRSRQLSVACSAVHAHREGFCSLLELRKRFVRPSYAFDKRFDSALARSNAPRLSLLFSLLRSSWGDATGESRDMGRDSKLCASEFLGSLSREFPRNWPPSRPSSSITSQQRLARPSPSLRRRALLLSVALSRIGELSCSTVALRPRERYAKHVARLATLARAHSRVGESGESGAILLLLLLLLRACRTRLRHSSGTSSNNS